MTEEHVLHGPSLREPIPEESLGQQLYAALLKFQDLPAVVDPVSERTFLYKDLLHTTSRIVYALQDRGYTNGSVVGIISENSIHYCNPLISALYLGCTVTLFSPTYTRGELLHLVQISKPSIVFCSTIGLKSLLAIRNQIPFLSEIIVMDTDTDIDDIISLKTFITAYNDRSHFYPVEVDSYNDVAFILYSSGTTGLPKGVMLTHRNFSNNLAIHRDPRYYVALQTSIILFPMFHINSLSFFLRNLIYGTTSLIFKKFEGLSYLKAIEKYRINKLFINPTIGKFFTQSPLVQNFDLTSVYNIHCSTYSLSPEIESCLKEKFINLKHVQQAYGMTETLSLTYFTNNDSRPKSSGKLVPNTSAKVIDKNGKTLGPNCIGELCFKGESVMKGYINIVDHAGNTNGWLSSGDVGYYDEEEYFYLVGRLKELIKYKGYQVSPTEIEEVLVMHPEIVDAAVVGLPHESYGELPSAFVVRERNSCLSEKEVQSYVAEKLSPVKWLRGGVQFVQELPKNSLGKTLRLNLKESLLRRNSKL